jgi:hypothetical protein
MTNVNDLKKFVMKKNIEKIASTNRITHERNANKVNQFCYRKIKYFFSIKS